MLSIWLTVTFIVKVIILFYFIILEVEEYVYTVSDLTNYCILISSCQ